MVNITLSATQMACSWDIDDNIARAEALVRAEAADGAPIILLQDLFETLYFCARQDSKYFSFAKPRADHPLIPAFRKAAQAAWCGITHFLF